jgi:hypothetical protein
MLQTPPPYASSRDQEQLKLIEIFHYVMMGLAVGGMAFLAVHYLIMSTAMEAMAHDPKFRQQQPGMPFDPTMFFRGFVWFYLLMAAWGALSFFANLASALCLRKRMNRTLSMIVAGFNCINVPFGTGLGICTLIVLTRSSVPALYAEQKS